MNRLTSWLVVTVDWLVISIDQLIEDWGLIGSFQFDQFERCTRLIGWICSGFVIMF
jgi:hypothetical protein